MGQGLKQRLLGVIVLLGLLVLLAPALFRGGETHPLVKSVELSLQVPPERPEFIQVLNQNPEPIEVIDTDVQLARNDQAGSDSEGYLKAWSLQLATFKDKKNATRLELDLKSKGYSSYTRPYQRSNGSTIFRVFIGPEVQQANLLKVKQTVDQEYDISSLMTRFVP